MAYATRANLEAMFGDESVEKWADVNGNGVEAHITARITAAIAYADGEIDDLLRCTLYTVPLVVRNTMTVPPTIIDIATRLAGVWLYESRGIRDIDPDSGKPIHMLMWHKEDAYKKLREVVSGVRHLDSVMSATPVPLVVTDDG